MHATSLTATAVLSTLASSASGFSRAHATRAQAFLARVQDNNSAGPVAAASRKFRVGDEVLGRVLPRTAELLARFPLFEVTEAEVRLRDELLGTGPTVAARSKAVAEVLAELHADGAVPMLSGWRDEPFAVRSSFFAEPALIIERAAAPLIGAPAYGVFVNGYVTGDNTQRPTAVWLGRRSLSKPTWPGLLDCVVAGGLAAGELPFGAMLKECSEEAGISPELASCARPAGGVSYTGFSQDGWGVKRDVLYTFDLRVPASFEPRAVDGEVESFALRTVEEVAAMLATPDKTFKPNVGVILVDFLLRHGFVSPDEPGYLELLGALRGAECS